MGSRPVRVELLLYCLAVFACSDRRARVPAPPPPAAVVLNEHGISVGDSIVTVSVACSDGITRVVADNVRLQLVTLTSVDDLCAECDRHLVGLADVSRDGMLDRQSYFLTYAPESRQHEIRKAYRAKTRLPVCFDQTGSFWEKYDIRHTPVTLLLQRGRVVYANDAPLDDAQSRAQMASAIAWYAINGQ